MPLEIHSPAWMHSHSKLGARVSDLPQSLAVQGLNESIPLLDMLAGECFEEVPDEVLFQLASLELKLDVNASMDRVSLVILCMEKVLRKSREEVASLYLSRLGADDAFNESLMDLFDTDELMGGMRASEQDDTIEQVRQVAGSSSKGLKRKPVKFPGASDPLDVAVLKPCLPLPDSRIYRDAFNKRWIAWYRAKDFCSSRSWGIVGDEHLCVRHIVRRLWGHHTKLTGQQCPFEL